MPSQVLASQKVVAPYWDDLFFTTADVDGVFTTTRGAAPNRQFVVSWQGHRFAATGELVRAQVVLFENSKTIRMIYGRAGGSATVGTQFLSTGPSTQRTCNTGSATAVVSGLRLDYLHVP